MAIYTQNEVDEAVRKANNPSRLSSFLPASTPYSTPNLTLNVPTKLLIPTTVKSVQDFALDVLNSRWFLSAADVVNREFEITMTTSLTASVNNADVDIEMWKNGIFEDGVSIRRRIGTGADVGSMSVTGAFSLSTNDYIEIYVKTSVSGVLTFIRTSVNILEIN